MKHLLILIVAVISLASCKTEKYVEVPVYKTEYVYNTDTLIQKDSVFIDKLIEKKGDTVYNTINKVVYKDKYHFIKYDSIRHDTITRTLEPVEKVVYVNKLNWFQSLLCYIGFAALLLLLIYIAKKFVKP